MSQTDGLACPLFLRGCLPPVCPKNIVEGAPGSEREGPGLLPGLQPVLGPRPGELLGGIVILEIAGKSNVLFGFHELNKGSDEMLDRLGC